ncbi:hypothetical protein SAMN04488074_112244 [Lentzea albidocapillata subsp. violacea]|uniref:Uncharacterized protein n=1 Tax=Lentzea albidocapillata subsp. violacea TaxID=128104 RepID=A0A1G9M0K7_9PSEU|nr:hypothetical protein [Lentzea albidocapillata]SDL67802.1 hypothetical protein SAMN04488074_112244 [Lentzea albidocapillata subsp. violacea]
MSEQEIREGMLLAVWDEPPLDFDPDTLIRRVEQKKSRRRALVAVGVATAVIAVASFSLPGLLPRDRDTQLGADTRTNSSAPPSESVEKKAQRIGDKLAENLGVRMTNLKEIYGSFRPGQFIFPPYSTSAPQRPGDPEFSGYVYLTDGIGPTALRVTVSKTSFNKNTFCSGASMCMETRQQDGSVVTEAEFFHGTTAVQQAEVVRRFESGLFVQISSYAYNPSNGSGQRETVPVQVGVLTQLVTDPGIAWE